MSAGFPLFLAGLAVGVMCVTAAAAAKRPGGQWNYFHFDGHSFVAGQPADGTPFVAVRDGVRPVLLNRATRVEAVNLEEGVGALVGICYQQTSGGKLKKGLPYLPCSRCPVQISAGDQVVATTQTDEQGYFLATLPAGNYRISNRETIEVTVQKETTTLVPLRVGKRMVD